MGILNTFYSQTLNAILFDLYNLMLLRRRIQGHRYWPPSAKSQVIELPTTVKTVFVSMRKSDEDGTHETVLNIGSKGGLRLVAFNREELASFCANLGRLRSYCDLWSDMSLRAKAKSSLAQQSRVMPDY